MAKPEVEATSGATGSVVNTFLPGIGSILALALGGLYHGYRQVRKRRVNDALIFTTVADLVDQVSDNAAARMTAAEIRERVERATAAPTM